MPYRFAQCIAYQLYTGPAQSPRAYVGLNSDIDDVNARVALMKEAISVAVGSPDVEAKDTSTLKIFMAPEFYFRGMRGAYELSAYDALVTAVTGLVSDPAFTDWLFVFGTALSRSVDESGKSEVYNVALVQRGGFASEAERLSKCVVVMKEFKSTIDFLELPASGLSDSDVAHLPAMAPASYALELNTPGASRGGGYNGGSIFMLDSITYGLEVCLDHLEERLVNAWPGAGDFRVQIQLIPSGGMTIHSSSVATLVNGLVFNVDGLTTATAGATGTPSYGCHCELMLPNTMRPQNLDALVRVTARSTLAAHADLTKVQPLFYLPPDNNLDNPNIAKPAIVVYPKQGIPAPEQAGGVMTAA